MSDDAKRLLRAKADEKEARAKIAQREELRQAGELVSIQEVEEEWLSIMRRLKGKIESWPQRVAPRLAGLTGPEIATAMQKEVRRLLEDLGS